MKLHSEHSFFYSTLHNKCNEMCKSARYCAILCSNTVQCLKALCHKALRVLSNFIAKYCAVYCAGASKPLFSRICAIYCTVYLHFSLKTFSGSVHSLRKFIAKYCAYCAVPLPYLGQSPALQGFALLHSIAAQYGFSLFSKVFIREYVFRIVFDRGTPAKLSH